MAWSASNVFTPILATNVMNEWGYNALWWIMIGFTLFVVVLTRRVKKLSRY
jgi:hypothetical protein